MKFLARTFALSLVVTGAFASSHIVNTSQPKMNVRVSTLPIPVCPPDDPNGCGMGN